MDFDWDPIHEAEARARRGHGFAVPARISTGRTVAWEDDRYDDGETRMIAVGRAEGRHWTVVYTDRDDASGSYRWIITAWPAGETGARTMARRSLEDLAAVEPDLDRDKLDATTDEDIRRSKAEDGCAEMPRGPGQVVLPPAAIRERLGMTQEAFARALHIPAATLRNWEQGRKLPDPAARSLLNAVARNPQAVLDALNPGAPPETAGRDPSNRTRRANAAG